MNFEIITDPQQLLILGWDEFINAHPEGTVFQSPVMYELFKETERMKPAVFGLVNKETGELKGILMGVIIRELKGLAGYLSSRTVIYGGPLIDPADPGREEILRLLLESLINKVKHHSIFIQFRNFNNQEDYTGIFKENGFYYRARLNLIVNTSSLETIHSKMSSSRLRQVRKGIGLGARCIVPENVGQVRAFYDILFNLYRYKVKKPLPAWDFFEQFFNLSKEGKLGIIRLVKYQDRIIGGILSPVTPGKTIYEWYVCGLDHEFKAVYPSVLATWAAIEYALKNKIPQFDFMGVGIPEREYGVREFKSRFGGEQVNYGRYARINNRFFFIISEVGYNFMTLMKKI